MKKATRHFLPRADFGKGTVALGIEINLERFLIRPDIHLSFHDFQDVGICRLLNRRVSDPKMTADPQRMSSRADAGDLAFGWGCTNNR